MSVVTTRTLRIVSTVDLEAVLQEIGQSSDDEIAAICVAIAAEGGPDVTREVIAMLNGLEWVDEEPEEEEDEEEEPEL
jgi:hypothetical protein